VVSTPFLVPPLLLVVVLVVSGLAKLRDPADTRSVIRQLQLPGFLLTIGAPHLLPWGELLVAALLLLLPGTSYVVATTLSLLLFASYAVIVARALRFPYTLTCGCFGRLGLGWITRQTLVRNLVLLALACVAWVDSWRGESVSNRLGDLDSTGWWWLAGVAVAMVLSGLVVREGQMPVPTMPGDESQEYLAFPIPYGVLDGPEGPRSIWSLTDAAARLLVFWDPREPDADVVADRLPAWQAALPPVRVHLVSGSEWSTVRDLRPGLAEHLLGDPDAGARSQLRVYQQPGAVLLGTDRLLAGGPAAGLEEIEELVEAAAEQLRADTADTATTQGTARGAQ
jgi:hypothetical protein